MIMPNLSFLIKVSRPRFWLYLFGPYLIGLVAAAQDPNTLLRPLYVVIGLYFLFPANLLVYGVNDIYDYETDKLNPKKVEYETLVTPEKRYGLWLAIFTTNFAFVGLLFLASWPVVVPALGFLFLSIFYSAPPIRAKAIPIVDSLFNFLYVMPGVLSYGLVTNQFPPASIVFAAGLWTMAMHAYSAIPDIDSDREAAVNTIATLFGKNGTLLFCLTAYVGSAALAYPYLGIFGLVIASVFVGLIATTFFSKKEDAVFAIYRYFPLVNAAVGFVLFWFVALKFIPN
jgi:4-hydroxybenzoate polyprenyltransferase